MTAHRIWYKLVNSDNTPFKKTTVDKLYLPDGAHVADLRKAVKTENDQPGYLKDVPANTLRVYADEQALMRGQSIEVDALVDGLGSSGLNPLLVVV